jgi:outer membrane protein TolC
MKTFLAVMLVLCPWSLSGQTPGVLSGREEMLSSVVDEALVRNPEIRAAIHEMGRAAAVVPQSGALDDPMLFYEREEMPGFQWNKPEMHKIGLMQTIRFPAKSGRMDDIAEINSEHAHHDHLEKVNEVVMKVKSAYFDLWFVQQSILLNRETAALLALFTDAARTKYGAGEGGQQDVLKAMVETGKVDLRLAEERQEEQAAKAMLMSLLDRKIPDSLGVAVLGERVAIRFPLDTLQAMALENRPLLLHDSLTILEKEAMVDLAQDEYLPDLLLGVEYINYTHHQSDAWTVRAGISLPFAPWTLAKAGGRVEEAEADVSRSQASFNASQNMVVSSVREAYVRMRSAEERLSSYEGSLLPQSRQAFEATLAAYRTGREDFLMLIDSYRTLVEISGEYLGVRRDFEKAVGELEFATGVTSLTSAESEGSNK